MAKKKDKVSAAYKHWLDCVGDELDTLPDEELSRLRKMVDAEIHVRENLEEE